MGGIEFNGNVNNLKGTTQSKKNTPKPQISSNDPRIADLLSGAKSGVKPAIMPGDGQGVPIQVHPITGEVIKSAAMPGDGQAAPMQLHPVTGEAIKPAAMPGDIDISRLLNKND